MFKVDHLASPARLELLERWSLGAGFAALITTSAIINYGEEKGRAAQVRDASRRLAEQAEKCNFEAPPKLPPRASVSSPLNPQYTANSDEWRRYCPAVLQAAARLER